MLPTVYSSNIYMQTQSFDLCFIGTINVVFFHLLDPYLIL